MKKLFHKPWFYYPFYNYRIKQFVMGKTRPNAQILPGLTAPIDEMFQLAPDVIQQRDDRAIYFYVIHRPDDRGRIGAWSL